MRKSITYEKYSQFSSPLPPWRFIADVAATPTPSRDIASVDFESLRLAVRGLCLKGESLKCFCSKKAHVHNNQMCIHISLAFIHQLYKFLLNTFVKKEHLYLMFSFFFILKATQEASNVYLVLEKNMQSLKHA